jgi:hypothetical protein
MAGASEGATMQVQNRPSTVVILAQWRTAQRQLDEATRGSPDHDRLAERVHDLSEEYRRAVDVRLGEDTAPR